MSLQFRPSLAITAGVVLSSMLALAQARADDEGTIRARATIKNTIGDTVGDADLEQTPHGVLLKVNLHGIPLGVHGLHIHEHGRCDPSSFESAGGHFAPNKREHGIFNDTGPHAGDLPNVHVLAGSSTSVEYFVADVTLSPGSTSSLLDADGSALVVHSKADDYRTNPAGAAGDRIACGAIVRR
jgi:Cu-Zn family superoxide dismutase